ncbi:AraC family transcriptional regulator, partial [Burkholderia pseudomallei]|nr:AraC family transcriptional regulator [Burkholderia pseudomallei]MBF3542846.1 AraC family transcriptional regulator [Burkholderia pseudomallei]MBF3605000.1 AraC family transcriptional regulator [Burkholderia pseudomallei]MBF3605002.1 AraC family transcriptional regulator [Burkholderia pseudomallei]
RALHYVAPVGEKEAYVSRAMAHVTPYLAVSATAA